MVFPSTAPRHGDSDNILLYKIVQHYAALCPAANAAPQWGDTDNNLLFKWAKNLSICGVTEACSDPAAPSGLAASPPNPGSLVTWTDNADNETGFEIRYRNITQGGSFVNWPDAIGPDIEEETIDTGLGTQDQDQIEIQVRAVNGSCFSEWVSITVTAEILN